MKGFKEAVGKAAYPNLPEGEDELTSEDVAKAKREKQAMKKNCLQERENENNSPHDPKHLFRRNPSCQAWLVMARLNKKVCPNDSIASLQTETELAAIKMKKNEDPSEFHDKLYEVKQRYPNAMSNLQVRNAMIRQYRKEYTEEVVKAMSSPDTTTDDLLEEFYWRSAG